jgi:PAS domain S-box-containing protein
MENIYKVILEDAMAGYWDWNSDKKTEYLSPTFKAMLGYEDHELPNEESTWAKIIYPADLKEAQDKFHSYIKSKQKAPYQQEIRYLHKNGSIVWIACTGKVIDSDREGNPIRIVGSHINITRQKTIEEDLRLSEAQFRGAFEYSTIGMALVSIDGRWLKVNKQLCKIIGYTEEELLNTNFGDITHPDDLALDLKHVQQMLNDEIETYQMEKRYFHKNGEIIWVLLSVSLVKNNDGKPLHFVSQIENISKRKEAENALIKVNQELSAILNSGTQVSIICTDLYGNITHANKGAEILLGYSAIELINQKPSLFHIEEEIIKRGEELSALYKKEIRGINVFVELARQGISESREWTYKRKDGSTFPVQLGITFIKTESGQATGFLAIATDISQIKNAEKALIESEHRWQFALEGTGDGIWDWNTQTNKVFYSKRWKKMLGYDEHEVSDSLSECESRIHPDDKEKFFNDLNKHLSGQSHIYINQHRLLCKDGSYKWILDRGKVIEWDTNVKALRVIGIQSDISWPKKQEEELRHSFDIISEQNKRLLNFAHIVSHNLRSHSGNLELLLNLYNTVTSQEERDEMFNYLKNISTALSETINNLNDVVSIQTNINKEKETLNIKHYIEKAMDILSGEINVKHVTIHNNISSETTIDYNAAYLESILLNFLSNAIKYSHPDRKPVITLDSFYEDKRVIIQITDNGRGIDLKRHGEKLFGMYKTFHGNSDAKGIGLFITKNQVEVMGGKIEVQSEVNIGTTFKIYLT